jgi:opacity protein-like surface antigen
MKARLIPAALYATQLLAVAGPAASDSAPITMPPPPSPWEFRLQPYAWLTAIDGSTGPERFTADIDAGFDDVFDVLDMAAALQFEARRGRWGFIADAFYAELGDSGTLSGPLQTDIDLDFEQFLGELVVFYRISESPQSFVDLYAGIRYNSISLDLEATTNGPILQRGDQRSADEGWTDPIIGIRTQWDINDRWFLAARGDIGGFGVASDFTWNLHASVGYNFTECVSLEVGYRYFDTDYDDGDFTYDIAQAGLLLGVNFRF